MVNIVSMSPDRPTTQINSSRYVELYNSENRAQTKGCHSNFNVGWLECDACMVFNIDRRLMITIYCIALIVIHFPLVSAQANLNQLLDIPTQVNLWSQALTKNPNKPIEEAKPTPQTDLIDINFQRFEKNHNHQHNPNGLELKHGDLVEAKIAAIPDEILAALPEDLGKQLAKSVAVGAPQIGGATIPLLATNHLELPSDDPDQASIERLTKSCLTIHASSAKPEELNVTFQLYTRQNPHVPYIMRPDITRQELMSKTLSPFDPSKPIKWITHGFHTNLDKSEWMIEAKDKILAFEDANVILTDWRKGASPALAFYPKAAANAHVVAKMIVNILRRIRDDIDLTKTHLIGHSLGAHIMGFVGSAFTEEHLDRQQRLIEAVLAQENQTAAGSWSPAMPKLNNLRTLIDRVGFNSPQLIGRITACDPALPCFGPTSGRASQVQQNSDSGPQKDSNWTTPLLWTHLRPDSAIDVEVMHSNPGVMGYAEALGDFDFYPNGVSRQPGCGSPSSDNVGRSLQRDRRQFNALGMLLANGQSFGSIPNIEAQRQPSRISQTFGRIFKPIREFFQSYTCSHHRAVEYMVESLYYDRIVIERKFNHESTCQMVGYRCVNYESFKKGHCFRCQDEFDCRAFTVGLKGWYSDRSSLVESRREIKARTLLTLKSHDHVGKFNLLKRMELAMMNGSHSMQRLSPQNRFRSLVRRALPSLNRLDQNYRPTPSNHYFFDTGTNRKNFCLHHYNILIKYRWLKVGDSLTIDGFLLEGTMSSLNQSLPIKLNKFTHQSYTLLLTQANFLGQIESLTMFGDKIRASMVEYIEINYMSNLDSEIRKLGSAKLCRLSQADQTSQSNAQTNPFVSRPVELATDHINSSKVSIGKSGSVFVSCTNFKDGLTRR